MTVETDEIIAEDNNKNIAETETTIKTKDSYHLILDKFIDKEESYNIQELNVNENTKNFEPIKEESIEEDEVLQHNKYKSNIPNTDEFEDVQIKYTYGFTHIPITKETINELDEEKEDVPKDNID